jgi:hypothetical protein
VVADFAASGAVFVAAGVVVDWTFVASAFAGVVVVVACARTSAGIATNRATSNNFFILLPPSILIQSFGMD